MRRRMGLLSIVAAVALLVGPSAGAASLNGFVAGEQFALAQWFTFSGCTETGGAIAAYTAGGAVAAGTTVGPVAQTQAEAIFYTFDWCTWAYSYQYFPVQNISPGAFTLDPVGNSGHIAACLTSGGPSCTPFDVTISRPGSTFVGAPGVQCVACYPPNAWVDAGAAHADTGFGNYAYILRYPYQKVTGTAGTTTISGFPFAYSYNIAGADVSVDAP